MSPPSPPPCLHLPQFVFFFLTRSSRGSFTGLSDQLLASSLTATRLPLPPLQFRVHCSRNWFCCLAVPRPKRCVFRRLCGTVPPRAFAVPSHSCRFVCWLCLISDRTPRATTGASCVFPRPPPTSLMFRCCTVHSPPPSPVLAHCSFSSSLFPQSLHFVSLIILSSVSYQRSYVNPDPTSSHSQSS